MSVFYDGEGQCPGCSGTGIQHNNLSGLKVVCQICGGSGKVKRNSNGTIKTINITWESRQ